MHAFIGGLLGFVDGVENGHKIDPPCGNMVLSRHTTRFVGGKETKEIPRAGGAEIDCWTIQGEPPPSTFLLLFNVLKLGNLHYPIRKHHSNLELSAHRA